MPSADFALEIYVTPRATYKGSQVLLARVSLQGTLELLTAAWARVLGYDGGEFDAKTLSQLVWPGQAAKTVTTGVLNVEHMEPVELRLRCRDGHGKNFRLHRHFDSHDLRIYIVAEELAEEHPGAPRAVEERRAASRAG